MHEWDTFLKQWPVARVRQMTLDQYTNERRDDAFVYWLEHRTNSLGGIKGGSSFKFGVARRAKKGRPRKTKHGRAYDARHMWLTRHGDTAEAAFQDVKRLILTIIDAAQRNQLEAIDPLPFSPIVAWKIAFLYQPRDNALIFPVYKRECLLHHYKRSVDPQATHSGTGFGQMFRALSERLRRMDVFERAEALWSAWEQAEAVPERRDWVIPLAAFGLQGELADALLNQRRVDGAQLPLALRAQLVHKGAAQGDRVALMDAEGVVRARGHMEDGAPEALCWVQATSRRDLGLHNPPQEVFELEPGALHQRVWGEAAPVAEAPSLPCPPATTRVYYGPPGTGKTREAVRQALTLCGEPVEGLDDATIAANLEALQRQGRIEMATFHPGYGYEEFVEGIRPVMGAGRDVGYDVVDGVFKRLALRAAAEGLSAGQARPVFDALWRRLLDEVRDAEGDYLIESLKGTIHALDVTSRDNLEARRLLSVEAGEAWLADRKQTLSRALVALAWGHREALRAAAQQAPGGALSADSLREVLQTDPEAPRHIPAALLIPVLRALEDHEARLLMDAMGPTERLRRAREALQSAQTPTWRFDAQSAPHVLIIDEINRGDLSRIMGELLTLLEPQRRLCAADATVVRLAVSGERFAVPPNLHVVGTMNTADRSIALLDVALRRRFTFEERMPDAQALKDILTERSDERWAAMVTALFETINARIRYLYDREHQLGHAYLLEAIDAQALRRALVEQIFPLLQEYFYDAWPSISLVLGCPYDPQGQPMRRDPHTLRQEGGRVRYKAPIVEVEVQREVEVLGVHYGERQERLNHRLNPRLRSGDLSQDELMAFFQGILPTPFSMEASAR